MSPVAALIESLDETHSPRCPFKLHHDLGELVVAIVSSITTTLFCLRIDSVTPSDRHNLSDGTDVFSIHGHHAVSSHAVQVLLSPSPGVMIASCLLLGCSVSSFIIRHRNERFLGLFLLAIPWALALGYSVGADAKLIMAALLPWSMVAAMAITTASNTFGRWNMTRAECSPRAREEKSGLSC